MSPHASGRTPALLPWIQESDEDERNLDSRQLPGIVLQTDGLTPEEVAELVLSRTGWSPAD